MQQRNTTVGSKSRWSTFYHFRSLVEIQVQIYEILYAQKRGRVQYCTARIRGRVPSLVIEEPDHHEVLPPEALVVNFENLLDLRRLLIQPFLIIEWSWEATQNAVRLVKHFPNTDLGLCSLVCEFVTPIAEPVDGGHVIANSLPPPRQ